MANVGCDSTGVNDPTGWNDCASHYAALSNEAKDYVYAGEADEEGDNLGRALARYDQALKSHPTLLHFIVDSHNTPRASLARATYEFDNTAQSNITIMVIAIALASITTVGVLLFVKKRKQN